MSGTPFDRVTFNPLEKPRSEDWNNALAQLDRTLRDLLLAQYSGRASFGDSTQAIRNGFVADAFRIRPAGGMQVNLAAGYAFMDDATSLPTGIGGLVGQDDLARYKPMTLTRPETIVVPAAPAGPNNRIDLIEVHYDRRAENSLQRERLNTVTGAYDPFAYLKTLAFNLDGRQGTVLDPATSVTAIGYRVGVPAVNPTAPVVTPGYQVVGLVNVNNGTAAIDATMIADQRKLLFLGNMLRLAARYTVANNSTVVSVDELIAPPSIRFAIGNGGGSSAGHTITVAAGGGWTVGAHNGVPSIFAFPGVAATVLGCTSTLPTWVTVDSALQAVLANPAVTTPAMTVGVGELVLRWSSTVQGVKNGGGGNVDGAAATTGDPVLFSLQLALRVP